MTDDRDEAKGPGPAEGERAEGAADEAAAPTAKALQALRRQLDGVDRRLLEALAERQEAVREVARIKGGGGSVVRDPGREEALLGRLVDLGRDIGLEPFFVTRVFREVLDHSLRLQHELLATRRDPSRAGKLLVVGFQGGEGAFSHLAAKRCFAARGEAVFQGFSAFRPMLEAVRDGKVDFALLPIENTTAGSINESYDLLAEMDLHLVGEEVQKVEHCLIGLEDVPLARIRRVYSHPVALAQCGAFLASLDHVHAEAFEDTALAVAKVKADQDLSQAAIASEEAARVHGLPILRRGVQDQRENYTRMVVVAREAESFDPRIPCKTSLVFATRHEKGALARGIALLAEHGLNLTKLESRPRPNTPWEYRFYLDFEGNLADPAVREGLDAFAAETSYLRVLGCYPSRTSDEAQPARPRRGRRITPAPSPVQGPARVAGLTFGEGPLLLAGPEQLGDVAATQAAARRARGSGADALWAGHLDPRERAGETDALAVLTSAAATAGLPLAVRCNHPADVARLAVRADLLVVDGQHMHDGALLREVGRVDCGVVLTRAPTATLDEWLEAAAQLRSYGNGRVVLLDAGVRLFDRLAPDLAALPEVHARAALPVLVDLGSSAPEGRAALARAAIAAGAAGGVLPTLEGLEALGDVIQ